MNLRLASLQAPGRDGRLVFVSADGRRCLGAPVATARAAVEDWDGFVTASAAIVAGLDAGAGGAFDPSTALAPLPRAVQYCEGSAYLTHMERCRGARGASLPPAHRTDPALVQGASDRFLAPCEPIELADENWGLDIETTVAVVLDDVRAGASEHEARDAVRLVVLVNDLTLRNLLPGEAAKGVGFVQSKPLRAFAPIAATPDALGAAWDGALLRATIRCSVNDEPLGELRSELDVAFDFPRLIAHAARTRPLAAGTILGSGTISNADPARGFGSLAEKRAVQGPDTTTAFLRHGDRVAIEAFGDDGRSLFGRMDTVITPYNGGTP